MINNRNARTINIIKRFLAPYHKRSRGHDNFNVASRRDAHIT